MSFQAVSFDPLLVPSGSFQTQLSKGAGTLHIINDSHVTLSFAINNFASMTTTVPAGATVNIPMCPPYTLVYWSTVIKLVTNVKVISSHVIVMSYAPGEPVPAEQQASRQVNPTNVHFTVSITGTNPSLSSYQAISIFNPTTSVVNATFIRIVFVCPTLAGSLVVLSFTTTNPGYATSLTPANGLLGGAASSMKATYSNGIGGTPPGTFIDNPLCGTNEYDLIEFPQQLLAAPGFGIVVSFLVQSTTVNGYVGIYWTETPV